MSKSKSKSNSRTSTTQTLNPWSQNQFQTQFDRVQQGLTDNPVTAYSGPLVAGLSGRETQARGLFDANMGSFNPDFDQARDQIQNAGLFQNFGDVSADYMNPYEQQVVDTTLADINRIGGEQMAAARGRAAGSGAYGGSRQAVFEGQIADATQRNAASTAANLRYTGYNDARNFYGRDIDARERRGGMLADLAERRHGLTNNDIMGLNSFGEVDRGIEQDRMGANYNEFLRQQEEQMRRVGIQAGLLGSIPMLTNTTGTSSSTQTQSPGLMGTLGAVGGLASMFVPGGQMAGLFSSGMRAIGGGGNNRPPGG
jgi:hypothetical protein